MKKLFALLMTGVFVLPLTVATLTYAQDASAPQGTTSSAPKKAKKEKKAKTPKEKKSKSKKGDKTEGGM